MRWCGFLDAEERDRMRRDVLNKPVKAGPVGEEEGWPFSRASWW